MTEAAYSASVQFMFTSPLLGPNRLQIIQREFAHDIAVMEFWADDVDSSSYGSGTPVVITYGRPWVKRTFYGYVNHASRTNNSLATAKGLVDRNATCVVAVGASYWMKEPGTQVWPSQTASQIVEQIAAQFQLDANVVADATIWPPLPMAGTSYWQFCSNLAQRIGYTFYCNGVQLVFKPRQTNPLGVTDLAAIYDYRHDPASLPVFTPTLGATNPTGGVLANRSTANINPRTMSVIFAQQSGSPSPSTLGTTPNTPVFDMTEHFTVSNQQEAQSKVQGAGATNQMYLTACATAGGSPLLSQGSLIEVLNANGSQNGLWFVSGVTHEMDTSTYSMEMELGRDSLGMTSSAVQTVLQTSIPPSATLRSQRWAAAA